MINNRQIFTVGAISHQQILSLLGFAAALVVTFAAYAPGLSGPLFLDDLPQLQGMIDNSAADPAVLFNRHIISTSGPFGRPVAMATFVGSAISHGPDTWWWKYENVMFHLITGLLIFWLIALLLSATTQSEEGRHWLPAAAVAAFWVLHPLHVSTVLYTVQRMTELSSLFVVAGLICYVKGRQNQISLGSRGWWLIFLSFGAFFPLAVLSKESALLFPIFCSLIEFLICRFRGNLATRKQLNIFHAGLICGYLLAGLYIVVNFSEVVLRSYAIRDFTLLERTYTELRIIVLYLSQLLLPVQGKMGFFHDDISLSTSLFTPFATFLSALLLVMLLGSALLLRKRLPLYAFGILFFFAGHLLESTIFPLELVFEHRNYLPSLGILLAVLAVLQANLLRRRGLIWITVIGLSGLSLLTWQRADTWSSPFKMYQFMYYAHPQSPRLNLIYANIYTKMENYDAARKSLATIKLRIGPRIHTLFLDCLERGKVERTKFLHIADMASGTIDGHVTSSIEVLTKAALDGKCAVPKQDLIDLIDRLLPLPVRTFADKQILLIVKARIMESMGEIDAALSVLHSAHALQPDNSRQLYFAAHTLSTAGRLDEAAKYLTSAYELEQTSRIHNKDIATKIYLNVGGMYTAQNQYERALAIYAEGILSVPSEPRFVLREIELLIQLQRFENAESKILQFHWMSTDDTRQHQYAIGRLEKKLQEQHDALAPIKGHQ